MSRATDWHRAVNGRGFETNRSYIE